MACAGQMGGCAPHRAPVVPPVGLIFTHYKAPLTTEFDRTKVCSKSGTAGTSLLDIPNPWAPLDFAWKNAAIEKAAANGQITKVQYADYEVYSILGIYVRFKVTVYGE